MSFIVHDNLGNSWAISVNASDGSLVATSVPASPITPGENPACSLTLQMVVNWARTQAKLIPIVGVGGLGSLEPALSICNNVTQEILAPPFNWKWNRVEVPAFTTSAYVQDYQLSVDDTPRIGWIESAVLEDATSTQPVPYRNPLTCVQDLQITSDYGNPEKLAFRYDSSFNAWWRLWPIPTTQIWKIYPVYQCKAPIHSLLTETWAPIPDTLGYVIRQGFLAFAKRHAQDPSWVQEYQLFQSLMQKALGTADAENNDETFYPMRPLLIG